MRNILQGVSARTRSPFFRNFSGMVGCDQAQNFQLSGFEGKKSSSPF